MGAGRIRSGQYHLALDVAFLIIAIFFDFASWGGGAYSNKSRIGFADD